MQHALTCHPSNPTEPGSNPSFNVLIAYQDLETGKHAKRTYDYLQANLGRECVLSNQMWKFDVLGIPKLREIAVKDALTADIIIISSYGDDLPEPVTKWIESWLMHGTDALALVALFAGAEESAGGTLRTRAYLGEVARRAGLEFFAQPDEWPGRRRADEAFAQRSGLGVNQRTLSTLAGAVHRGSAVPRWGMNE
jgi:hypothetical protein